MPVERSIFRAEAGVISPARGIHIPFCFQPSSECLRLSGARRTVNCAGRCGRATLGSNVTAMFFPSPTPAAHFGIRRGLLLALLFTRALAAEFDVRAHGATGDGQTLDTAAIHRAIAAASAAGGGTVRSPAGTLLSFSIRLKNNVTLHLDAGATLLAAPPPIFLAIFHDDRGGSEQAVYLYLALKKAAEPPELHEWGDGGHDYCIHPGTTPHTTYPALAADWMAVRG